jgi:hypothetical protein
VRNSDDDDDDDDDDDNNNNNNLTRGYKFKQLKSDSIIVRVYDKQPGSRTEARQF